MKWLIFPAILATTACGSTQPSLSKIIAYHRWSQISTKCGGDFISFDHDKLTFVKGGIIHLSIPLLEIRSISNDKVLVVFDKEAAADQLGKNAGLDGASWLLQMRSGALRLVDWGDPNHLVPVPSDSLAGRRFRFHPCM